jgi:hypothetical protein
LERRSTPLRSCDRNPSSKTDAFTELMFLARAAAHY